MSTPVAGSPQPRPLPAARVGPVTARTGTDSAAPTRTTALRSTLRHVPDAPEVIGTPARDAVRRSDPAATGFDAIPIGSGVASPACRFQASRSSSGRGRSANRHPCEWSSPADRPSPSVDIGVTDEVYVGSSRDERTRLAVRRPSPWVHDPPRFHPHLGTTLWMDRAEPVDGWARIRGQLCGEPGMNRGRTGGGRVRPPSPRPVNGCPHGHVPSRRGLLTSHDVVHPHHAQHL